MVWYSHLFKNFPQFVVVQSKAEEPEIKLPTSAGSSKKKEFQKTSISALLTMPKPLTMWMLKLKLQYFGHLMRRADSFEKTLMLGKIEGRRRRG